MICRHCSSELKLTLVDLGSAPPSNGYLTEQTLRVPEKWFPLRVLVCENCWLVQTEDFARPEELFHSDYAYFSAYSSSWLEHCEQFVAEMTKRFALGPASHVVEIAANDGYLLQYVRDRNIPCIGVEPTAATAEAARAKGIPIVENFFGVRLAREMAAEGKHADLTIANNVLAHVPDINDFVGGFAILLNSQGVATFEFPHLLRLIAGNQFDTIYHEHYSYLSLTATEKIFAANGLTIFDIDELTTHGGSLRVYARRSDTIGPPRTAAVDEMLNREQSAGITTASYYAGFQSTAEKMKNAFLAFLLEARKQGKCVAAYGAAAKGNTLMNYAGVRPDLISFVADRNPAKQGKYMPGSRIPVVNESFLRARRPDYVVILPWNLRAELTPQLEYIRTWGGKYVTAVPEMIIA